MFASLLPDLIAPSSVSIPPMWLYSRGIRALILDIDNTLVTYDDPTPTPALLDWFGRLQALGIKIAFVSNNRAGRVNRFNESLGFVAFARAKKPLKSSMEHAIAVLGVPREQICVIGDQFYTDVLAAKRCGLFAILVPPLRDKRDPFTRFKRLCERPFLSAYRKRRTKRPEVKLAVLGAPIAHSLSPLLHHTLAELCQVNVRYDLYETTEAQLGDRLATLREQGYRGFNCTMPLKTEMSVLAARKSDSATRLCSVNTVLPIEGGYYGDSTDGIGIIESLTHHGIDCFGKRVVLLGAGGAARSIADALIHAGADLTVLNRTEKIFDGIHARAMTRESLVAACRDCDVLIQATSLGMEGKDDFDDLSFLDALPSHAAVVDAVYHPLQTSLLSAAKARGLLTVDGLYMLLYQGVYAFALFTGVMPDRATAQTTHDKLVAHLESQA